MTKSRFHACATCIHFEALKTDIGMSYRCSRLGYSTKPKYQFDCWTPKDHIKRLMEKEEKGKR